MWIEIYHIKQSLRGKAVTPLAGVWIEIDRFGYPFITAFMSLPLRECGLKLRQLALTAALHNVTPLAGVWIEIG